MHPALHNTNQSPIPAVFTWFNNKQFSLYDNIIKCCVLACLNHVLPDLNSCQPSVLSVCMVSCSWVGEVSATLQMSAMIVMDGFTPPLTNPVKQWMCFPVAGRDGKQWELPSLSFSGPDWHNKAVSMFAGIWILQTIKYFATSQEYLHPFILPFLVYHEMTWPTLKVTPVESHSWKENF